MIRFGREWCESCQDYTEHRCRLVDHRRTDVRYVMTDVHCVKCGRSWV